MENAERRGWFGDTVTLEEQLRGLEFALAEARGKTVLDAGCAEGWIAREFLKAGALKADAFDHSEFMVAAAREAIGAGGRVERHDVNKPMPDWMDRRYDIVLALAVIHKGKNVERIAEHMADRTRDLLVVRLPRRSRGEFGSKHWIEHRVDLNVLMPRLRFTLERMEQGPKDEMVQYWRRA